MINNGLKKIIGAAQDQKEHVPVALLLRSGYACFGHFNSNLNEGMESTLVLLNAQLMELKPIISRNRPVVEDFREFLLEIVAAHEESAEAELPTREDLGQSVLLVAIPLDEISIVYPVAQIVQLIQRLSDKFNHSVPTLFDLERSEIVGLLRTKLLFTVLASRTTFSLARRRETDCRQRM